MKGKRLTLGERGEVPGVLESFGNKGVTELLEAGGGFTSKRRGGLDQKKGVQEPSTQEWFASCLN